MTAPVITEQQVYDEIRRFHPEFPIGWNAARAMRKMVETRQQLVIALSVRVVH